MPVMPAVCPSFLARPCFFKMLSISGGVRIWVMGLPVLGCSDTTASSTVNRSERRRSVSFSPHNASQGAIQQTFLRVQRGSIHRLAERLHSQLKRCVQIHIIFVLLSEQTLGRAVVGTDAAGLPSGIVARRIRSVQLEFIHRVPTSKQEADAKGTQSTILRVTLLEI